MASCCGPFRERTREPPDGLLAALIVCPAAHTYAGTLHCLSRGMLST